MASSLAILGMPGGWEVIIILVVGLILFGGRLPEVGKSLGRSLVEFRKGLRGIKEEAGLDEIDEIRRDFQDTAFDVHADIDDATHSDAIDAEFQAAAPEAAAPEADAEADAETESETPPPPLGDAPQAGEGDGDKPPAFGYQR